MVYTLQLSPATAVAADDDLPSLVSVAVTADDAHQLVQQLRF